ncbi:LTA synthase family protein [Terrisporobacter sp.]|uniref:LTA synthase family protein n=1 Tax=Terrisporobacter sp. TaxID=1965305 RepID=UPI002A821FFA|nr:LTA synthase family protein [Terrisporobacter sp.]MDY4735284.1 LTA synthase family protein [Terrisporobacter sp.]
MKKKFKDLFKVNKESIREVLLWLIGGLFLLFITEFLLRGKIRYVKLLLLNKPGVFLVNFLLILILTSFIFILKRKKTFYFLMSFIILTISCVSKYLYKVRGVPFTFSDIYSIGEALEIAGNYVTLPMVVGVLIFLILIISITIILFKQEKNNKRIRSLSNVLLMIILMITFPIITKYQYDKGNMSYIRWDITASYKKNGYVFSTIESAVKYIRVKPKGYSKKAIEEIRDKVDEKEKEDNRKITGNKPNIIFIQLEAFMDPTKIKEAKFSEDPIPNFRKICDENKGYMANVPTTGGGTVRTEYEVMTGNNIDYLTPGEIPYNTILKGKYYNSIATTLKSQGYGAHAIHNFQGNFYTRNNAYEKLGFDTFTSIEYMNGYEKNERGWVKDKILTKYIKKALNSTEGSDLVYTIAVQGHSSYPKDSLKLYDFPIKVSGKLSDVDKNQLYYYVNQLKETDEFIGDVMDMVDNSKEDTLVVFYSDHMPALNLFQNDKFYLDAYEAPFAFYSNFEMNNFDFDKIEAYNISSLALELAGVEYGPMEKFRVYLSDDKDYESYEALLEYDMLFGKNYYLKNDEKPEKSTMKMGLNDITVTSLEYEKDYMIIQGSNFTENSAVYIDNKKVDTIFINDKTLKIKMIKTGDTLQVKQLGRNDGLLSKSNSIDLLFSDLAKK